MEIFQKKKNKVFWPVSTFAKEAFQTGCQVVQGRGRLKGQDGSLDDVSALANLVLFDDEGRGQANDVTVGGLGQQSVVTKAQADLPGVIV